MLRVNLSAGYWKSLKNNILLNFDKTDKIFVMFRSCRTPIVVKI